GGATSWKSGERDIKLIMEPAAVIEGKVVVQDTDQPVPGARLWLVPDQQNPTAAGQLEPAIAGADGLFRISDISSGSYRLQTIFGTNGTPEWVAEMVSVTAESGQTTRDVKVSATCGGLLEVVVIAKTDRKPVPEVSVSAYTENFQAGAMS